MGLLEALEARLDAGECGDPDNGYHVRTKAGKKLGPMEEYQFNSLRWSQDVDKISNAWRMAGGSFYKVELTRRTVWDQRHACSLKACNHACEVLVILLTFGCTTGVFVMLMTSKNKNIEREMHDTGPKTWALLMFMMVISVVTAIATVITLVRRWRAASTEVFVSEV